MKKPFKIALYILLGVIVAAVLGFYIWSQQTYKATEELYNLVTKDDYVIQDKNYVFKAKEETTKGIILYPGAKVEPLAYGYLGKSLAEKGYEVVIPTMRLNMAVFDMKKAESIMEDHPNIEEWIIGGHSLGGAMAASYAAEFPDKIAGLVLFASYPADSVDFSKGTLPILSIYGGKDKVAPVEDILASQPSLSSVAILHEIKEGNHAGFGMYGDQADDGKATISNLEQQNRIVEQIDNWLNK